MRYRPPDWFRLYVTREAGGLNPLGVEVKERAFTIARTLYTAPPPGAWKDRFLNLK